MPHKKILAMVLFAVVIAVSAIAGYKIISEKKTEVPSTLTTNSPLFLDTIDYSENLLDSNQVYKELFEEELTSKGKWIPVKQTDLIKELTTPPGETEPIISEVKNVSNAPDEDKFVEEIPTVSSYQNITSTAADVERDQSGVSGSNNNEASSVKIIYIWQPNEADRYFNPYSNGRWQFTSHGWMWQSDYAWGNHCYNYGRWFYSSFYGWVWMPGDRWAPNWVSWRDCGPYVAWYPTCPVIYWTPHTYNPQLVVCNPVSISNPSNWTIMRKININKKVTKETKIPIERNTELLNTSVKIKTINTFTTDDRKIKYSGPNVNEVTKITKEPIVPLIVNIKNPGTSVVSTEVPTKYVSNDPVITRTTKTSVVPPDDITKNVKTIKTTSVVEPTKTHVTTKDPVNDPINTKTTVPVKTTTPIKTTEPVKEVPKKETTKTNPPVKTTSTKKEEPKQEPTKKKDEPKREEPKKQEPKKLPPLPKVEPPKYEPLPPVKNDPPPPPPPVKNDPPPPPPPVKNDPPPPPPPVKNDPPPPPPKKDDGKKAD